MARETTLKPESGDELERNRRRYVELLREPTKDEATLTEIRRLAFSLDKTVADVAADQQTIDRVAVLRLTMRNGRGLEPALVKAKQAADDYAAQTRAIMEQLQRAAALMSEEYGRLSNLQAAARAAVTELNTLRTDGETMKLLADEPEATAADLN